MLPDSTLHGLAFALGTAAIVWIVIPATTLIVRAIVSRKERDALREWFRDGWRNEL